MPSPSELERDVTCPACNGEGQRWIAVSESWRPCQGCNQTGHVIQSSPAMAALRSVSDDALIAELRRRGYEVSDQHE